MKRFFFILCIVTSSWATKYEFDSNVIEELKKGLEMMTQHEKNLDPNNGALKVYKQFLQDVQTNSISDLLNKLKYNNVRKIVEQLYDDIEADEEYNGALIAALTTHNLSQIDALWERVSERGIKIITNEVESRGIKVLREVNHLLFLQKNHNLNPETQGKYIIASCVIRCMFMQMRNDTIKKLNDVLKESKYIQ